MKLVVLALPRISVKEGVIVGGVEGEILPPEVGPAAVARPMEDAVQQVELLRHGRSAAVVNLAVGCRAAYADTE